jgi:hypothetical protein
VSTTEYLDSTRTAIASLRAGGVEAPIVVGGSLVTAAPTSARSARMRSRSTGATSSGLVTELTQR